MSERVGAAGPGGGKNWRAWVALLGGALAWTAHLMLAYAISEFGCVGGWGRPAFLGVSPVSWLLILASVLMIALAAAALLVSYRIQRPAAAGGDPDEPAAVDEAARLGLISNGLFLFIILVQCVPIFFFLGRC